MMSRRLLELSTRLAVGAAVVFTVVCVAAVLGLARLQLGVPAALAASAYLSVPVVGSALARARPRQPIGWILLASGVALPVALTAFVAAEAAFDGELSMPGAWLGWLDGWPWVFVLLLPATVGLLLFPDGRVRTRTWRWLVGLAVAQAVIVLCGLLFGATLLDFPDQPNPTALPSPFDGLASAGVGAIALTGPLSTAAAVLLHRRRRRAASQAEADALRLVQPATWVVAASWWLAIGITIATASSVWALPAEMLGMVSLAATAWLAIRRYRLFDIRQVVSRAAVYGTLTVAVIGCYLAVASLIGLFAQARVSQPVAVACSVLVAIPLRDALQRLANRFVYGHRDDPYGALASLGRQLAAATEPTTLIRDVLATVRRLLRLPYLSVELRDQSITSGTADGGPRHDFPLVFAGETVGTLVAVPADAAFGRAEHQLLSTFTAHISAAAHALALTSDVQRSRERIVAAAEDERRRLRRDLHDGLGPALAGVVLGIHRARRLPEADARSELDEVLAQTQAAVAEVRRLVYGLRPPALDELGLVSALTERAHTFGAITVVGPEHAPDLPAAVEVAAYRIALEAMTNAARHSRASATTVTVSIDDAVHIEVSDDGIGLPPGYRAGVGITSMRERAAELGGACTVEPKTAGGTVVRAVLPRQTP